VDPVPSTQGHVRFKGATPDDFVSVAGDLDVVVIEGGSLTMQEQFARARVAFDALVLQGYRNVATSYRMQQNVTRVKFMLPLGSRHPSAAEVAAAAQAFLESGQPERVSSEVELVGRAAEFRPSDIEVVVFTGSGPILEMSTARGGTWLRVGPNNLCTGGWAVKKLLSTTTGIMTAAHCFGLNIFVEPGVGTYTMTFQSSSWASHHDTQWFTTTATEVDDFYADASAIRDVTGVRSTFAMVGSNVCRYGRMTNFRSCDHWVTDVLASIEIDEVIIHDLAVASGVTDLDGDSGGGWSFGNTAWGVHTGRFIPANESYFTSANEAEHQLSVDILQ
jgi:hypothetical protein